MHALLLKARRAAQLPVAVLVHGETGVGKEVIAQQVHQHSPRCSRPLLTVNCGALPNPLLLSTLLGHVRGAFTGAVDTKPGLFEQADKGTVFLDEVSELPPEGQLSVLRVLEAGRVTRLGSTQELEIENRSKTVEPE